MTDFLSMSDGDLPACDASRSDCERWLMSVLSRSPTRSDWAALDTAMSFKRWARLVSLFRQHRDHLEAWRRWVLELGWSRDERDDDVRTASYAYENALRFSQFREGLRVEARRAAALARYEASFSVDDLRAPRPVPVSDEVPCLRPR